MEHIKWPLWLFPWEKGHPGRISMVETAFFYLLGSLSLLGALGVLFSRNPIYSAFSLVGSLIALAGVYALLEASLIAVLQVMVYAGAVMMLFIFIIMLLDLRPEELRGELGRSRITGFKLMGVVSCAGLFGLLSMAAARVSEAAHLGQSLDLASSSSRFGSYQEVAKLLFTHDLLPFEAVSLLLLAAIVGAVVVAKGKI